MKTISYITVCIIGVKLIFWAYLSTAIIVNISKIYQNEPLVWKLLFVLNDAKTSVVCILYIIILNLFYYKTTNLRLVCLLLYLLIFFEIKLNFNLCFYTKNFFVVNTKLTNGLLLIHPVLLYKAMSIFFFEGAHKNIYVINVLFRFFQKKIVYAYLNIISFLAVLLGAWWAQQEFNWGGWWNYDPIEMIALYVLVYTIYAQHTVLKNINFSKIFFFKNTPRILILNLLILYYVSRFDMLNSIHSFINQSLNNYYEYKWVSLFLIYAVFITLFLYAWVNKFIKPKKKHFLKIYKVFFKNEEIILIFNFLIKSIIFLFIVSIQVHFMQNSSLNFFYLYTYTTIVIICFFIKKILIKKLYLNVFDLVVIFIIIFSKLNKIFTKNIIFILHVFIITIGAVVIFYSLKETYLIELPVLNKKNSSYYTFFSNRFVHSSTKNILFRDIYVYNNTVFRKLFTKYQYIYEQSIFINTFINTNIMQARLCVMYVQYFMVYALCCVVIISTLLSFNTNYLYKHKIYKNGVV